MYLLCQLPQLIIMVHPYLKLEINMLQTTNYIEMIPWDDDSHFLKPSNSSPFTQLHFSLPRLQDPKTDSLHLQQ